MKKIQFKKIKYENINCFLIESKLIANPLPSVIFQYLCIERFDMIQKQTRDNFGSYLA